MLSLKARGWTVIHLYTVANFVQKKINFTLPATVNQHEITLKWLNFSSSVYKGSVYLKELIDSHIASIQNFFKRKGWMGKPLSCASLCLSIKHMHKKLLLPLFIMKERKEEQGTPRNCDVYSVPCCEIVIVLEVFEHYPMGTGATKYFHAAVLHKIENKVCIGLTHMAVLCSTALQAVMLIHIVTSIKILMITLRTWTEEKRDEALIPAIRIA